MKSLPISFLVPGRAFGPAALLRAPLSLWGGFDTSRGVVMDATHPDVGKCLRGAILMMTEARGSSSSSSALLEASRNETAPSAIVLGRPDPILTIGSLIAMDLYKVSIPIVLLDLAHWPMLTDGRTVEIDDRHFVLRFGD